MVLHKMKTHTLYLSNLTPYNTHETFTHCIGLSVCVLATASLWHFHNKKNERKQNKNQYIKWINVAFKRQITLKHKQIYVTWYWIKKMFLIYIQIDNEWKWRNVFGISHVQTLDSLKFKRNLKEKRILL